jgi:hypothetical protein
MATRRSWVPIVAGVAVLLGFVGLGAVVVSLSWMREHLQITEGAAAADAARAFDEARARFPGRAPLLELDEHGTPRYVGGAPAVSPQPGEVTSVHVLAWNPREGKLARFELPFWFLRLKSGPITFSAGASGLDDHGVNLDPADVERFGPGLLLDAATRDGQHVLLWAQ